jgi:hypothetical protein
MAQPKYLGTASTTYEMMKYLLFISDGLRMIDAYTDPARQVINFIFESDELIDTETGRTYEVYEGQNIPAFSIGLDSIVELMRAKIRAYDIEHGRLTNRELLDELKEG